jgi:hypothetical protein
MTKNIFNADYSVLRLSPGKSIPNRRLHPFVTLARSGEQSA